MGKYLTQLRNRVRAWRRRSDRLLR